MIRIGDTVSTQAREGKYEFEMALKPDFLGKVSIKLIMEDGGIRMQIRTQDMGVKSLFTDQMSGLQSLLRDKGFSVTSIDVTYQSTMAGGHDPYSQSREGESRSGTYKSGRLAADTAAGAVLYETLGEEEYGYMGVSSVEYLA